MKQRLETWYYALTFRERCDKSKQELLKIKAAISTFRDHSKSFLQLLEIILAIGNFINSGGSKKEKKKVKMKKEKE